ncbi:MAG: RuBisCO large subunit C-terminal-like domain-containing protein [Candidatus Nanopelagicales bacterium]
MSHFTVTYQISQGDVKEVAEAIRVEQTIEFPFDLAPNWIQKEVVGEILEINGNSVKIKFDDQVTGFELSQFLNVLWGNVSLFEEVKIVDLELSRDFLSHFKGPRFGISGLRDLFGVSASPLLATALKPMGLSAQELAKDAEVLVQAGFNLIKDDHGLANQPWALWQERVQIIAQAVRSANAKFNKRAVYAPSLNLRSDLVESAHWAKGQGAGALLILPGVSSFALMQTLAEDDELALPLMSHPSMLGSFVMNKNHGLSHGLVLATIMRLAGADISIFPNYGGRFSFSQAECKEIAVAAKSSLGDLKPIWTAPGGGMTLDRIEELVKFFGPDTMLLVGGALHRGDLYKNASGLALRAQSLS